MTDEFTLPRTGNQPLRFRGQVLAEGTSRRPDQKDTRWHGAVVYRTAAGKFVVLARFRTRWEGEQDDDRAEVVEAPEGVVRTLREYDPVPEGIGYPPGDSFAEKQRRMEADLRARWAALVGRVLAECGFAERVE